MNEKQRMRWEKQRAKGKKKFVWMNGVLGWGVPMALVFSFIKPLVDNQPYSVVQLLLSFTIFPLGGILFGLFVWKQNEKRYFSFIERS